MAAQREGWPRSLRQDDRWTAVVESSTGTAAVASFGQARTARAGEGEPLPGVAHLGALFVDRDWWGRGVGRALLAAASAEMTERGFRRGRLIVPEGNTRARDLYARGGWETVGPWRDEVFGLPLLELRLDLAPP